MRTSPLTAGSGDGQHQYNLVYYDPEMHWCRVCDIFPRTAKEYLNHLHSDEHKHIILVLCSHSFVLNKQNSGYTFGSG